MPPSDTVAAITPLVAEFRRIQVPYYIGGSVAGSARGIPRSTMNVDIVADLGSEHVAPLVEALRSLYYIDAGMISEAIRTKSYFNVVYLEMSFKVDVFVQRGRQCDRAAFERSAELPIDEGDPDSRFLVASAEDTILSKLEWFRLGDEVSERQWLDVIGVLKVQQDALDRSYLEKWASELGVVDLLSKAFSESQS